MHNCLAGSLRRQAGKLHLSRLLKFDLAMLRAYRLTHNASAKTQQGFLSLIIGQFSQVCPHLNWTITSRDRLVGFVLLYLHVYGSRWQYFIRHVMTWVRIVLIISLRRAYLGLRYVYWWG